MSEKPVRDRPRRLADGLNPTGGKEGPLLGGSDSQAEVWGVHSVEKCHPRPGPPRLRPRPHPHRPHPACLLRLAGAWASVRPVSFKAPALLTRPCESWVRETRTPSLSGGRRPALRCASSDPTCAGSVLIG